MRLWLSFHISNEHDSTLPTALGMFKDWSFPPFISTVWVMHHLLYICSLQFCINMREELCPNCLPLTLDLFLPLHYDTVFQWRSCSNAHS